MGRIIEVNVEDKELSPNRTIRTLILDYYDGPNRVDKRSFYFDIESDEKLVVSQQFDFAVLSVLFEAMHKGHSVVVRGPVSAGSLENLEEFQLVFSSWFPDWYSPIQINADEVASVKESERDNLSAVSAFSGGVDSCFTVHRHLSKRPGHHHKDLKTVVLVQGWDIPIGEDDAFRRASENNRRMLSSTGLNIAHIRTDSRALLHDWEMNFSASLGAVLNQFSAQHAYGLIGSDEHYGNLALPWGSNPISNHLMSSDRFKIVTDGAGYTRTQKISHFIDWDDALRFFRVCWEGPKTGLNCCKCEKCIRTILNFRALGAPRPEAFPLDVSDRQIREMRRLNAVQISYMEDIVESAKKNSINASWLGEVERLISRNKRYMFARKVYRWLRQR